MTKKKESSPSPEQYVADAKAPALPSINKNELEKVIAQLPVDQREKLGNIKQVLETFKDNLLKRFEANLVGVSLLPPPPQQEGQEPEDPDAIHVFVLLDDKDSNRIPKEELQEKVTGVVQEIAKNTNAHLKPITFILSQVWQHCYDAKYDPLQMVAMGAAVYDTGMLAAIKISEIHKSMVLKKFEKYIVSYVLAGSLTQGKATPESDIDVFIVIDDTDVKKMTRVELRDKLRAIIVGMGLEAGEATGIRNKLNMQVYILTDFWDSIKDANPTIFTFLRDGVPFYDRGVFMPWKQLLAMGRVKPSPEAIDMFMSSGNQFMERIYAKIRDIVMEDLFWALITPSQAALMLYGYPPPTPKETPVLMKEVFVDKEKLFEAEHIKTMEKMLKYRKGIEHGTIKKVTGKEMDDLVTKSDVYLKRLDELFKAIDERKQQEKIVSLHETTMTLLRDVFRVQKLPTVKDKDILSTYQSSFIDAGILPHHTLRLLTDVIEGKKQYDANKLSKQHVNTIAKDARELHKIFVEFIQRKQGEDISRSRVRVKYGDLFGEVFLLDTEVFIVQDLDNVQGRRITKTTLSKQGRFQAVKESSQEELEEALQSAKSPANVYLHKDLFEDIQSIFGKDAHILLG